MKFHSALAVAAVAGVQTSLAFPHMALKAPQGLTVRDLIAERAEKNGGKYEVRDLIGGLLAPLSGVLEAIDLPTPQNQVLELVPDDAHPYIAPGPNDIRGLCPTMNTMANHGYISRDGITTFAQGESACWLGERLRALMAAQPSQRPTDANRRLASATTSAPSSVASACWL